MTITTSDPVAVFWFRRDLRLNDNRGLNAALRSGLPVLPIFIFDTSILSKLAAKDDARVNFLHEQLHKIQENLKNLGGDILVLHGKPEELWKELIAAYNIKKVFFNRDYEPYAAERDWAVQQFLEQSGSVVQSFKDHVLMEPEEVLKDEGTPYTVFTPYSKKWKLKITQTDLIAEPLAKGIWVKPLEGFLIPELNELGFERSSISVPSNAIDSEVIRHYKEQRNFPSKPGTSRLSVHLRFGTISIRKLARIAKAESETFLNELIWRDFYQMIIHHFPRVVHENFKRKYDHIPWINDEHHFQKWCNGETGYPIVDAGMRELNATGFMHNRVRMVTASFLTKHLLTDWRWGEAYFAEKLLDFELASNNGGWQWAAGTGCDAAPYFRVFNPYEQAKKFDGKGEYIRRWVPEFDSLNYALPIVDHAFARKRAIETYKIGLNQ